MNNFTIYYDSLTEVLWFQSLSKYLNNAKLELIKPRGQNPSEVEDLLRYDKPDIIMLNNNEPVLVLEKSSEVPTGHNVGQRVARLVRGVEKGIITIYYFPFDAMKHGKHQSLCNLNIRLLEAAFRMYEIHDDPLLCVNWIIDNHGELVIDGSENKNISKLVDAIIKSNFDKHSPAVKNQLELMKKEYQERLKIYPRYAKFPPSVRVLETKKFLAKNNIHIENNDFLSRKETVVYKIGMSPKSCKRQDPYTGTQFIYDYMRCRTGVNVEDKKRNLILHFPKISKNVWFENNPNNLMQKSSNWYLTANGFLFEDDFYFIR